MKLVLSTRRPCELSRGEARRVSQRVKGILVGYHVCCPRCGFVTVALNGHQGFAITESDDGAEVSFSHPLRCMFCKVLIAVTASVVELQEDEHVRQIHYRR